MLRAGGRRWNVIPSLASIPGNEDTLIAREEYQAQIAAGLEQLSFNAGLMAFINQSHKVSMGTISQSSNGSNLMGSSGHTLNQSAFGMSTVTPIFFYLGADKIIDLSSMSAEQYDVL